MNTIPQKVIELLNERIEEFNQSDWKTQKAILEFTHPITSTISHSHHWINFLKTKNRNEWKFIATNPVLVFNYMQSNLKYKMKPDNQIKLQTDFPNQKNDWKGLI